MWSDAFLTLRAVGAPVAEAAKRMTSPLGSAARSAEEASHTDFGVGLGAAAALYLGVLVLVADTAAAAAELVEERAAAE